MTVKELLLNVDFLDDIQIITENYITENHPDYKGYSHYSGYKILFTLNTGDTVYDRENKNEVDYIGNIIPDNILDKEVSTIFSENQNRKNIIKIVI